MCTLLDLSCNVFSVEILQPSTPMRSPATNDAQESLTIGVADEHIGAVVGRAGRNITEIIQVNCRYDSRLVLPQQNGV